MTLSDLALAASRKTIAILLIISFAALIAPTSIAAPLLKEAPGQLWVLLSDLDSWISKRSGPTPNSAAGNRIRNTKATPYLSRAEKEAAVAGIRMNCSDCTEVHSQEPLQFVGVPVDSKGDAINGLGVKWVSSNNDVLAIDDEGKANPKQPGKVTLLARTENRTRSVEITVLKPRNQRASHHASAAWDVPESEVDSLYKTQNIVGSPAGKLKPMGAGESSAVGTTETGVSNFLFSREIVSLPGRAGLNASLSLVLNSQVWTKTFNFIGNPIHRYDVDSGWPAPGFRLGLGQIEKVGNAPQPTNITLTEPDGTRRPLKTTTINNYDSQDGSFIHYTMVTGGGTLFYPDGTQVVYGAAGGGKKSYPTKITDRNGNYIVIAYKSGVGPKIDTVKDTLERYISFFYAANGDLVAIKAPGLTTGSERQVMRFYYEQVSLTTADLFDTAVGRPTSARVIRYIFLPSSSDDGADTGFRFDYSVYGMVHTVKEFRGMTVSTESLTDTGTVTADGTEAAVAAYNYPTAASDLVDPPQYTQRSDDWAGRTGGGSPPVHNFSIVADESRVEATVTAPDGTITVTNAMVDPGFWADGLITRILVQYKPTPTSTPVVVSETQLNWEGNPVNFTGRIKDIRITNDASPRQTKSLIYSYDASTPYNNVSVVSETDFTTDGSLGTVLRRTETSYLTSSSYLNRRLYHLPTQKRVYAGTGTTPISRTDFAYDQNSLTTRSGILMFDPAFDPSSGSYVSTNAYRGNVTTLTTYPDASTTLNAINRAMTYDIAGNMISAQLDCCQVKSFTYTISNQFAYPTSVTSGNPGGPQLTTSKGYDYNTGLVTNETDANTQLTSFTYEPISLRVGQVDRPGGGQTIFDYSDALLADSAGRKHSLVTRSEKLDATRFVATRNYVDGRGAVTQTFSDYTTANGWAVQDIEYDSMGRRSRVGNPYYCTTEYGTCPINSANLWTTNTYDQLDRVTQITKPRGDDANPSLTVSVQISYVGSFTTITDEAGRQRRRKTDALDRVVRLDEPNSSGSLGTETSPNQSTSYQFDVLDNMVKITQGSQNRYFKYDSLSRLIREFQVEQVANASYNLADSLTGNSSWTRKLEYNSHGLVTKAHDARGIRADLYYDGLNRLTLVDYTDATPDARYFYDSQALPAGAPSFTRGSSNGRVVAMTYGTASSVTGSYFGYDVAGRVNVQKQVTGANTYSLAYTYNLAGQLATETYPSGRVLTHSYDNAGRPSQVNDATTTYVSGSSYAASRGLSSETWGNGAVRSIAYNNALAVSQIKLKQSSSGSELQRYDYQYGQVTQSNGSVDKSKNRGQIARIDGFINGAATKEWEQRFSYDELGRLGTAAEYQQGTGGTPTWQQQFTYDRYGNRFQSGAGNSGPLSYVALVSSDINANTNRFNSQVTYDAAGNILQDLKFRSMNYTYDANGRQISAAATAGSPSQTSVYDCSGQRVQTTSGGITTTMVYDTFGQLVADYNGSSLKRENIYRLGQLLAVQQVTEGLSYVLTDAQGSTRALMNNSGSGTSTITSRRDYLPFGEEIGAGVGLRSTAQKYSQVDNVRRRFGMMERDDVSGLDHTLFRKYEAKAGRWTSIDPKGGSMSISDPQTFNRYSYVGNDPINFVDPLGLDACFAVFLVETLISRDTGLPVGPSTWKYLFSYCLINGRMSKVVLDPAPRPSGNSSKSVAANDRMKRFQREYDKCIERRKQERTRMAENLVAESIVDGGKDALLYGAPAGGLAGFRAGMVAGKALPPPGQVLAPPVFAIGGAAMTATGVLFEETGRNIIKGWVFDILLKQNEHEKQDNPVCESEAAGIVLN